jgi:hypothetical protein
MCVLLYADVLIVPTDGENSPGIGAAGGIVNGDFIRGDYNRERGSGIGEHLRLSSEKLLPRDIFSE